MTKKIKTLLIIFGALLAFALPISAKVADAQSTACPTDASCGGYGSPTSITPVSSCDNTKNTLSQQQQDSCTCDGTPNLTQAQIKGCQSCNHSNPTAQQLNNCLKDNQIIVRMNQIINVLSGLVALVITGSIIYGGFQYIIGGDVAENVHAGKARIMRSLIALIAFLLTYGFLQWVIPGGL